jgi:hypothetical protein
MKPELTQLSRRGTAAGRLASATCRGGLVPSVVCFLRCLSKIHTVIRGRTSLSIAVVLPLSLSLVHIFESSAVVLQRS